ncbi:MAG: thiosulfate oxidation carrier protein SoxY [Sulfuritalea sp.]|nr:thiosulfate oxidation carrier protein SoxY [Sulfuritalea sp.]MBN8473416.1 thiosulfate oxidation carrier protein SoxY [Sulfuritalea sp.]
MNPARRTVLRGAGSLGALSALVLAGVLKPTAVYAADWNKAAFEAKDTPAALKGLGAGSPADSKDLVLKVPDIAENGAVVPVDVVSNIPNTTSIAILVDKNPTALTCLYAFTNGALPEVSARIKMGQTSLVRAVAKAGDKYFVAQKECKVTVGGCGG